MFLHTELPCGPETNDGFKSSISILIARPYIHVFFISHLFSYELCIDTRKIYLHKYITNPLNYIFSRKGMHNVLQNLLIYTAFLHTELELSHIKILTQT